MFYVTISQKLKFSMNALLKNKNCFANILRTDRDISKIPTDTVRIQLNSGFQQ